MQGRVKAVHNPSMFAAVQFLYREGVGIKPQSPPLVGQLNSGWHRSARVLYLWSLDWLENAPEGHTPLATLWQPVFVGVGYSNLVVRGYEVTRKGRVRRWTTQKWLCDVMTPQRARDYLRPDPRFGDISPTR